MLEYGRKQEHVYGWLLLYILIKIITKVNIFIDKMQHRYLLNDYFA